MSIVPTVFLVDDHPAVLKGLSRLLGSASFNVMSFESAQAFLDSRHYDAPGCLVVDMFMPGMSGLGLQQELTARASLLPLIFLTGQGDLPTGIQAMKAGAADFLTKPVDGERLIDAVRIAIKKNDTSRLEQAQANDIRTRLAKLTPREREVLFLLIEGKLNKQVAAELGTVEKTIKVHRARVMTKMGAASMTALVRLVDRITIHEPANNQ